MRFHCGNIEYRIEIFSINIPYRAALTCGDIGDTSTHPLSRARASLSLGRGPDAAAVSLSISVRAKVKQLNHI